ncbi:MAG: 50S ribosomal protein L19e [Nanoarchaeota archaeon]|nr:50S ribosomal protein L19e [Nanoarchaeota archaeon]MDZ4226802.1 50S ribosomal protein L19e [Candidatus Pacearchaeota archaeon]
MNLSNKKRIAAQVMKCGESRVKFDVDNLKSIKEAITKSDIRALIKDDIIKKEKKKGVSRATARKVLKQKRKGRRSGPGRKSGTHKAREPRKKEWMNKIRAIRNLISTLKEKKVISPKVYRTIYNKSKGGFFRSRRHVKLYLEEHKLIKNEKHKS